MSSLLNCSLQKSSQLLTKIKPCNIEIVRGAAKKGRSSTQNSGNSKPKHRTWKLNDGHRCHPGQILVTQNWTRFHPGLNVIMGRNGTLNALEEGRVVVTAELTNPFWEHSWIQRNYADREGQPIYKKYFNVIPDKQHCRFKLKDTN